MIISRKAELTLCVQCQESYDDRLHKPRCFMPCGHTFCEQCIRNWPKKVCIACKRSYNQHIPDYEMTDMVKEKQLKTKKIKFNYQKLDSMTRDMLESLERGTTKEQLNCVISIRKLLSLTTPPIQEVIDVGVVEKLVEFLDSLDNKLVFESCWALTNVLSGDTTQTQAVIDTGVVPKFVELVESWDIDVCEQAIWALGNIAGDNAKNRDLVIDTGVIVSIKTALVRFSKEFNVKTTFQENSTWILSNLCRYKPQVTYERIQPAIEVFEEYIYHADSVVLSNVCWAIFYLTDGSNDRIGKVMKNFNLNRFVELMSHENKDVKMPAIKMVGNIITGTDEQTQAIIDCGVMPALVKLTNSEGKLMKEIFWTASNIAAGTISQIKQLIDSKIVDIGRKLLDTAKPVVQKEIAWTFCNIITTGGRDQIEYVFKLKVFEPLCNLLQPADGQLSLIILQSLQELAEYDAEYNDGKLARYLLNNATSIKLIEELLNNKNPEIYELSEQLIAYLRRSEESDDEQ